MAAFSEKSAQTQVDSRKWQKHTDEEGKTTTRRRWRDAHLPVVSTLNLFCSVPARRDVILPLSARRREHGETTPLLERGLPTL